MQSPLLVHLHHRLPLVLLCCTAVVACTKRPETAPPEPPVLPVTTTTVTRQNIPLQATYPGIVYSPRNIQLNARVEGFLLPQVKADGAIVKTDDVIYRIDPRQYEAAVLAAQGSLAQAIANRDYAAIDQKRNEPLVGVNAISQLSYDQIVAQLTAAEGQVLTAKANLVQAELNLSFCTVTAPFAGMIGASEQFEGDVVGQVNSTELNSLVQLDPLWAQFSPASTEWPKYQDLLAKGPLSVSLTYDGDASLKTTGQIIFSDNQIPTSTSTLMLRAQFTNPTMLFRPGAYVKVEVILGTLENALVVPERAVFAREADTYIWRVKSDNTVESVLVALQREYNGMLAITGSIAEGDRIVVDGIQRMKLGARVEDTTTKPEQPEPVPQKTP
ncbi:MAG: efflux RND transporter periplasmic adaptor subunit [Planctomycetes bacterium]|nr:efflux RND transporter periplasmic adaptor subunit [Planctomycetota bacterium]